MRIESNDLRIAYDLARRDLAARYSNASLGVFWIFLTPIVLALIYWLVFGRFLQLRWTDPATAADVGYIAPFFAGLATYLFFNDIIISSLNVFKRKRNFVRRSPFPTWVIWLSNIMRATISASASLVVLFAITAANSGFRVESLIWTPVALALIAFVTVCYSFFLSVIGPFFGDLEEAVRLSMRVLFYTSSVTYPITLAPAPIAQYLWFNPLLALVESLRRAVVFGLPPDLAPSLMHVMVAAAFGLAGVWLYRRVRGAIVDVV